MRAGVAAAAVLTVTRATPRRQEVRWRHAWPVVLRPTGDESVHLVHGAGGPLGGDRLALTVDLGTGAALAVRSAGATLVQAGREPGPARWDVTATVAADARLDWAPEPTIVSDGAALHSTVRVDVAAGGSAVVQEVVVLGRHGQRGGRYEGSLVATAAGRPLCAHLTLLDGQDPVLSGPGGLAGARAMATVLVVGAPAGCGAGEEPGVRWAWTPLDGPGALLMAVGTPAAVTAVATRERRALTG